MSIEYFVADIVAKDEEGREFPKKVILRSNPHNGEWVVDFGWPAGYYLRDLLDPVKGRSKGLCLDGGGCNHKGSPVWVDPETFLSVIEKALELVLEHLKGTVWNKNANT